VAAILTLFTRVRGRIILPTSDDVSPPLRWYLPSMRQMPIVLLCVVALAALFVLVGCTDGGPQGGSRAEQGDHAPQKERDNVELTLRPEHDSGVSGNATFEDIPEGVLVMLHLGNLPRPNTFYLAHIHPGTCAQGETREHGGAHGAEGHGHEHSHEHGGEIEYPLSQVKSDSEGQGSSTTTLRETSVKKLFSGEPKYVNVHEAGSGNPPILTCANLKRA
jgi:hypothetical protein